MGDTVQAVVVSTVGGLKLSHKLARGAATRQRLGDAYRAGLPVEGRVEKTIKGGFEVRVGGQRAFCPISQIDTSFTSDAEILLAYCAKVSGRTNRRNSTMSSVVSGWKSSLSS